MEPTSRLFDGMEVCEEPIARHLHTTPRSGSEPLKVTHASRSPENTWKNGTTDEPRSLGRSTTWFGKVCCRRDKDLL